MITDYEILIFILGIATGTILSLIVFMLGVKSGLKSYRN